MLPIPKIILLAPALVVGGAAFFGQSPLQAAPIQTAPPPSVTKPQRLAHGGEVHDKEAHDKEETGDAHSEGGHGAAKETKPQPPAPMPTTRTLADLATPQPLPDLPTNPPAWLSNTKKNHIFYKRGVYNDDVYNVRPLALDLNAISVGHALAYEDLVTGRAAQLETKTFGQIDRVLKNPPRFMPDEANISPTFGRKYGVLEQVFDWTHILHAQTVDVLASTQMTHAEKDKEIEALWDYYFTKVPYALTPLPMNMGWLDTQPYSKAFRSKYPKVNGLFWGYHWLQGAMYDGLYGQTLSQQKFSYAAMGKQYHERELYRTDRPFMPMFAETSPKFAAQYPKIANAFDNLHMLHDLVNDILATDWMTPKQKNDQILRAIWLFSNDAHRDCKPGDNKGGVHDHRFMDGMPGMGMMQGATTNVMWMDGMGWMSMNECHHCSMPLAKGDNQWRSSELSANGWTMRVRCVLCARDMSAEVKGAATLRIPLEAPDKILIVLSDEAGNLTTDTPDVLFLEEEKGHAKCYEWSRAFSNRAAFEAWVKDKPEYQNAKLLTFAQWSELQGEEPDTYVKPEGPTEDSPYLLPNRGGVAATTARPVTSARTTAEVTR
jgi:hypothetical protein